MSEERKMVGPETDALVKRWHLSSWLVAGALVLAAVGVTGFQLDLQRRPATEENLARAERWAVRGELRADFGWLRTQAAEPTARVGDWLDAVELATLQRRQFSPALSEGLFRECVLEPEVGGAGGMEVRRALWTHFAPRVRKESEVPAAAAIVARELRTRVTPFDGLVSANLARAWDRGRAGPPDWERLYIAALRACGVAARLSSHGRAEVWSGGQWLEAPRPLAGQTHE